MNNNPQSPFTSFLTCQVLLFSTQTQQFAMDDDGLSVTDSANSSDRSFDDDEAGDELDDGDNSQVCVLISVYNGQ